MMYKKNKGNFVVTVKTTTFSDLTDKGFSDFSDQWPLYLGLGSGTVVGDTGNPNWPDVGDSSMLGESNPYGDLGEFKHPNGGGARIDVGAVCETVPVAAEGGGGCGGRLFCGGGAFSCCCWYQRGETKGANGDKPENSFRFESIANIEFWRYRMYEETGDSAAAWTGGSGGRGESGAVGRGINPPVQFWLGFIWWEPWGISASFSKLGGRLITWAKGGGRILCRRELCCGLGWWIGCCGGAEIRSCAGEPVSFWTTSLKSFLLIL